MPSAELHAEEAGEPDAPVLRTVSAFVRERQLSTVDGWRTTRRLAASFVAYAAAAAVGAAFGRIEIWLVVWMLQGLLLLGLVAVQHEGLHGLLYRNRRLNHLVGGLAGAAMFVPYTVYRHSHLEHHRHTSDDGDTQPTPPFRSLREYVLFAPLNGLLFVGLQWWFGLKAAFGRPPNWLANGDRRGAAVRSMVLVALYLTVAVATTWAFPAVALHLYWAPLIAFAFLFVPLVTLPEHYGCAPGPASALLTSRSTTSNAVLRWCFWGTNFHAAHHLNPGVPAPRLGELHDALRDRGGVVESSYGRWHLRLIRQLIAR